jgi:tetratricopeptide (TPR) repeat protein
MQTNPTRFEPDLLAQGLNNLSVRLAASGDVAGALAAIREAFSIFRRLALANPARFEPELAGSLRSLSNRLAVSGHAADALAADGEAVSIHRRLAQANPARFEPELARCLYNLAVKLANSGDAAGALAAILEAVAIWRGLAQANPARFEPDLAKSLNHLSALLKASARRFRYVAVCRRRIRRFLSQISRRASTKLSDPLTVSGGESGALAVKREAAAILSSGAGHAAQVGEILV